MLLHDVIMTSFSVYLLTVPVFSLCETRAHHAHPTVEQTCQEMSDFITSNLWPPNSPDLNPVHYDIWAVMQHRVYQRQIRCVDELKRRLVNVWCILEQSIFDKTTN